MSDPFQPHIDAAMTHHRAGRLAEAERIYRDVLRRDPNHAMALGLLGAIAHQTGNSAVAEGLIEQSVRIQPAPAGMWNNLGLVRMALGKFEAARDALEAARRIDPNHIAALNNLAHALWRLGRTEEAMQHLRRVLEVDARNPDALSNLADLLFERGQIDESIAMHRRAVEIAPQNGSLRNNLAKALVDVDPEAAAESFARAIELDPKLAMAMTNLGLLRAFQGYPSQAMALHQRALALTPNSPQANVNLGTAELAAGRVGDAVRTLRKACALDPMLAEARDNLLWALLFDDSADREAVRREHREWGMRHAEAVAPLEKTRRVAAAAKRGRRIGYVSGDFRDHAVAHFIEPVLRAHDRSRVEVYCYSNWRKDDAVTGRIRALPITWREIAGRSDDAAAQMIRDDDIDILIDLAGHTARNRLPVFARKPAPIQVTWLGYPHSTGVSAIDCWISDPHLDPAGQTEPFATEQLIRLPRTFTCYAPPPDAPPVADLPAIAKGHVTFGSFNMVPKMNDRVLAVWARVLDAVQGSRMLIVTPMVRDEAVHAELRDRFSKVGVARERLDIRPAQEPVDYLRMHGEVDIVLDTFPFTGHTVTLHALWMGCPVVTLAGDTHISRRGVSIMNNLGLPDLIACDEDDYIRIARELADDITRLSKLRASLRLRMQQSPLLDAVAFTREFEDALISLAAE